MMRAVRRANDGSACRAAKVHIVLQPVGPLPPQVYWRRRLVLLGGIVLLLMLGLAMRSGGSGPRQSAGGSALTSTPTPTGEPSGVATITPSPGSAGGPAPGPGPATGATGPSATPPAGTGASGTTPASTGPSGSPGTGPSGPLGTCPDAALTVQASTARPAYRVGETPVFKLSLRNTGSQSCVRDVGPRQQEMLLYAGTTRIWSSNDCYPDGGTDVRTLDPGEAVSATVVWSGLSSQPGCAGARIRVQAGSYRLVASVGTAKSKPATLILQ
jgi:hypothetical protein